nr:craniofacial development protein 2-like [Vanessa tameamea]
MIAHTRLRIRSHNLKLMGRRFNLAHVAINNCQQRLCEVRRQGENIIEDDDYIVYYLGKTKGFYGVGFLVKKKYKGNIKKFIGISERIRVLEIEIENLDITIIQAYVPTDSSSQEDIDNFYEDLAKAHDSTSSKYIISMGDFNSQIGLPKAHEISALGKYGY